MEFKYGSGGVSLCQRCGCFHGRRSPELPANGSRLLFLCALPVAGSIRQSLAIPETLFFYTLVPGIFAGALFLFRKRLNESLGVLMVTMTVTFGYAIGQGNVGTLYRHKAQVIGFYYAFAAIGIEQRRQRQRGAGFVNYADPRAPLPGGRAVALAQGSQT
jgi:hypothetical protein